MKLIGCMAVRNEAWCLGLTLRAALQWCDEMVVFQHACTDGTQQIIWDIEAEHPGRIINLVSSLEEWHEMPQRQAMLEKAREFGATHIAIVDADELLTGNLLRPTYGIRQQIAMAPKGTCLQLPMYQLRGSLDRYHANGIWGNRWLSVAFQDDPRLSWSGDTFHSREPKGMTLKPYRPIQHGQGGSFHLWGVSERRLAAKHALYRLTERVRWPEKPAKDINQMYDLWRAPEASIKIWPDQKQWGDPWTFSNVPTTWLDPYKELIEKYFHPDIEPWQTAECERIIAEHGREYFQGIEIG